MQAKKKIKRVNYLDITVICKVKNKRWPKWFDQIARKRKEAKQKREIKWEYYLTKTQIAKNKLTNFTYDIDRM